MAAITTGLSVQALTRQLKRYDEFLHATDDLFFEFKIWKLETDLTHIRLDGFNQSVKSLLYFDWLRWRLEDELKEDVQQITENIDYDLLN